MPSSQDPDPFASRVEANAMRTGAVPVRVTPLDEWACEERIELGLPMFKLAGAQLLPSLRRFRGVTVAARDWIPIQGDKAALAVHTPEIYFSKQATRAHRTFSLVRGADGGVIAQLGRVREIDGVALLVGGTLNHYHWLVDNLPRLLLARKYLPTALPTVLVHDATAAQIEALGLAGVERWQHVSVDESVYCEELWIVDGLAKTTVAHPVVAKLLREAYAPKRPARSRSLLLSRNDASTRRIVNEDDVLAALPGFERHTLGSMTFQEQVELFHDADCVVAAHGAGMANIVFCRPGTRVIEIHSPLRRVESMQRLARLCGLRHTYVAADIASTDPDPNPLLNDWRVDVDKVRQAALESA